MRSSMQREITAWIRHSFQPSNAFLWLLMFSTSLQGQPLSLLVYQGDVTMAEAVIDPICGTPETLRIRR